MENAYGIGITNRYALFLDEESDPLDILKASEADKLVAKAKKIEAVTKPAAKSAPKKEAGNNKNDADKENQRNNKFEGKKVLDAKTVEIVETAGTVVLVPTVAQEDLEEEEAEAVEARKNSAWTRRLSPLWARLPLKVEESKKFQTTTFSSRANTDY